MCSDCCNAMHTANPQKALNVYIVSQTSTCQSCSESEQITDSGLQEVFVYFILKQIF